MTLNNLILVGSNHKTAPLELLQSISLSPEEIRTYLPTLQRDAILDEVVLLSTCNRTEIYASSINHYHTEDCLKKWLLDLPKETSPLGNENLFTLRGQDAVRHLFQNACGLDSLMVGETEITGQIQSAYDLSRETCSAGSFMTQLFSSAFHCAKRARTKTAINEGITSVASAAVHMARRIFGDLEQRSVLVVGAGDTGKLLCSYFVQHKPKRLFVANRTFDKAVGLARQFGVEPVPLERRAHILKKVDVVVCATHSKEPLITETMVAAARKEHPDRMLLLVDISLPRNIAAEAADYENVFLSDMNDLHSIVKRNLSRREEEIPKVVEIIDDELREFCLRRSTLQVGPLIKELRDHYDELRRSELERFSSKLNEEARPIAERLTRDLVNKLLHWPTLGIRELTGGSEITKERIDWSRSLFGLDRTSKNKGHQ